MGVRIKYKTINTGVNKHPAFIDAWHFFKMLMILFWAGAVVSTLLDAFPIPLWFFLILLYPAWNGTFVLFYKYIWANE